MLCPPPLLAQEARYVAIWHHSQRVAFPPAFDFQHLALDVDGAVGVGEWGQDFARMGVDSV
jgi:hypothetical protein